MLKKLITICLALSSGGIAQASQVEPKKELLQKGVYQVLTPEMAFGLGINYWQISADADLKANEVLAIKVNEQTEELNLGIFDSSVFGSAMLDLVK